jgi:hypothetical protein
MPQEIEGTLYDIRVKGNLDPKWTDWFEDFDLTSCSDHETLLSGKIADQAALHGILSKINNLGLSLILVAQIDPLQRNKLCPMCGQYIKPAQEP